MTTLMTPAALAGCLIASLVFVVPLRALAIVSNIAFIGYGYLGELWPIVILHAAMLPVNMHRLRQEVLLLHTRDLAARLNGKV
jgi:hypothetical protein